MGLKTYTMTNPNTYEWLDWVNDEGAKAIVDINILNRGFSSARVILALADKDRKILEAPSNFQAIKVGDHGHGRRAAAVIGSGINGAVDVRVKKPGLEGNEYTIEVITTPLTDQPLTANIIGEENKDLRIILATDSTGDLNTDANKASLVAAAIENIQIDGEQIFVAEVNGTGEELLTIEETKKLFHGGVEGKDYAYRVTALDDSGETLASEIFILTDCHPSMNDEYYINLSWSPVIGARTYKVYGRIENSEIALAELDANITSYDDKMRDYLGENLPWANTTGLKSRIWEGELNARFIFEIIGRKLLLDENTKLIAQVTEKDIDFTAFGADA